MRRLCIEVGTTRIMPDVRKYHNKGYLYLSLHNRLYLREPKRKATITESNVENFSIQNTFAYFR